MQNIILVPLGRASDVSQLQLGHLAAEGREAGVGSTSPDAANGAFQFRWEFDWGRKRCTDYSKEEDHREDIVWR